MISAKRYEDAVTGRELAPSERVRAFTFPGGPGEEDMRVKMNIKDLLEARSMGIPPGLRVLGTLERSWLKPYHQIAPPHFLYPTDQDYVGSRRVFAAFLNSLVKKNMLAIGLLQPKKNASPY